MNDDHFIRMEILKKLLFATNLSFSELKPESLENNKFSYHLKDLMNQKFISKLKNGKYSLTKSGKEYANRMATEDNKILKQGKISIVNCCVKNLKSKDPEFLIYTRLKHPFYGAKGYPTGKVTYGETVTQSAERELKEETNLDEKAELFMIEHHLVYEKDTKELLEDKYFYFCRYIDPKGKLIPNEEGDFEWVKMSKLEKFIDKTFESIEKEMYITKRTLDFENKLTFEEVTHIADNF